MNDRTFYPVPEAVWFSSLPETWQAVQMQQLFSERSTKVSDKDFAPLTVGYMGIVPQLANVAKTDNGDNRKLIKKGDFAINSRSDRKGAGGISEYDGSCSVIITVLKPHNELNGRFYHYLLRSHYFSEEFYRNGYGIVDDLWSTKWKTMRTIYLPVPPCEEQNQIVHFLDWKVSEINRLINIKRKEIERLEELKKAVVSHRLSGEKIWLKRLLLTPLQYGANSSGTFFNSRLPRYVRITDIDSKGQLKNEGMKSIDTVEAAPYILENGDVLLARSGATVGKAFMYKSEHGLCAFAGYLIRAKLNTNVILPEYFIYFTESLDYSNWKDGVFIQATIQNISAERYNKLPVPVPSIEEQQQIVTYLDKQTKKINTAIANKQQQIQTMQELKNRLISDVVTGKIDVRGIEVPEYEYTAEESDSNSETEESDEQENET